MKQVKYLLKNISVLGVSQFASKLLVFFMLPFCTRYLSTAEYGNADLIFTVVSLMFPVFTLEISSAVMRFTIENNTEKYLVCGINIILIGFGLLLLLKPFFNMLGFFDETLVLFYILFLFQAIYTVLSYYARGCENIKLVGICGLINTAVVVVCNIMFLAILNKGLYGYLMSYIVGYVISGISLLFGLKIKVLAWKSYFDKKTTKEMIRYSLPLVPNNMAWWGVSSANKFMIQLLLNEEILGLYSAALRIPSLISTVQGIISEGLVLSVLAQYRDKNQKGERYYSLLYEAYSMLSIFMAFVVIISSKGLASFLFATDFSCAWEYVPLLCIAPVWGSLSGYLGTFYAASKRNKSMFISTALGASISVIVGSMLIGYFGVYAIIAGNIISYFGIWLYRWIDVKKIVHLQANIIVDLESWLLLVILAMVITFVLDSTVTLVVVSCLMGALLLVCNYHRLKYFLVVIKHEIAVKSKQK